MISSLCACMLAPAIILYGISLLISPQLSMKVGGVCLVLILGFACGDLFEGALHQFIMWVCGILAVVLVLVCIILLVRFIRNHF